MEKYINKPLNIQNKIFLEILYKTPQLIEMLRELSNINLPNHYIGGGYITQTIWNHIYRKELHYGISDIDIVYYCDKDLSEEAEKKTEELVIKKLDFLNLNFGIDVKNEARVHLWYEKKFGIPLEKYESSEEAIASWPSYSTAIGVRMEEENITVFAPYGFHDLFSGIIRHNKILATEEVFFGKAEKWKQKWPDLVVL
jgi:Uncharacterized protein conserved in bacteria